MADIIKSLKYSSGKNYMESVFMFQVHELIEPFNNIEQH